MENYTQVGFLITALLAVSGCLWWLVKKIIHITTSVVKDNTEAFQGLKHAIYSLEKSIDNNIEATKELKQTINNKL